VPLTGWLHGTVHHGSRHCVCAAVSSNLSQCAILVKYFTQLCLLSPISDI